MKQGLLLKEAPEEIYIHRCYRCDTWHKNSLEFQIHLEKAHNQAYAWYYSETISFILDGQNNSIEKINLKLRSGWCKADDSKIIMRAVFSTKIRPLRRMLITQQELKNRRTRRTCHCGDPVGNGHYKYCSGTCQSDWYQRVTDVTNHRNNFMSGKTHCEKCGIDPKEIKYYHELEMDHIIAIVLGGHPWDERNLIALCHECHNKKTKSDMGILAWWKRQAKYDTGPIIPNPQLTLDEVIQFEYAY